MIKIIDKFFKPIGFFTAALLMLLSAPDVAAQQDIPQPPDPPRLVNDFAGILPQNAKDGLERELRAFRDSTSVEIAVVIVKSLGDYDISQYAFLLGDKWGVGSADFDNGVVILLKPKMSEGDRGRVFIAPGYGLEGAVTDAATKLIVEYDMIPYFKKGDYAGGIASGLQSVKSLARGEFTPEEFALKKKGRGNPGKTIIPFILILLAIAVMIIGRVNRARHYAMGRDIPFWTALMMAGMMNTRHTGTYGSFRSGTGSFGGGLGGGGGFGGFGGGSFGGGGAGGSW